MFCPSCGRELDDKAAICIGCGRSVEKFKNTSNRDSNSVGWWWLGFFLPMVGFILWCVWTGNSPLRAKRVGWGAIVGIIVSVVMIVLFYAAMILIPMLYLMMY